MQEIKEYKRIGTMPHRSYYIPFAEEDNVGEIFGIIDRTTSTRFTSLDGVWQIVLRSLILMRSLTERSPFLRVYRCTDLTAYST